MIEELKVESISGFSAGEDLQVEREVTDIPEGQVLALAWLTVKAKASDTDADAVIQKRATPAPMVGVGVIVNEPANSRAVVTFDLLATDTSQLTPGTAYFYDIKVKTDIGRSKRLEWGAITADTPITITNT